MVAKATTKGFHTGESWSELEATTVKAVQAKAKREVRRARAAAYLPLGVILQRCSVSLCSTVTVYLIAEEVPGVVSAVTASSARRIALTSRCTARRDARSEHLGCAWKRRSRICICCSDESREPVSANQRGEAGMSGRCCKAGNSISLRCALTAGLNYSAQPLQFLFSHAITRPHDRPRQVMNVLLPVPRWVWKLSGIRSATGGRGHFVCLGIVGIFLCFQPFAFGQPMLDFLIRLGSRWHTRGMDTEGLSE